MFYLFIFFVRVRLFLLLRPPVSQYVASLQRDVLPKLTAHAKRLDALFHAIDAMAEVALPAVEQALDHLEKIAKKLEADRTALEPSTLSAMLSYFGGGNSSKTSGGAGGAAARAPWVHPELFDANAIMQLVMRGGAAPASLSGGSYSPASNSSSSNGGFAAGNSSDSSGNGSAVASGESAMAALHRGEHKRYEVVAPDGSGGLLPLSGKATAVASSVVGFAGCATAGEEAPPAPIVGSAGGELGVASGELERDDNGEMAV
jgi:hypothetical protein